MIIYRHKLWGLPLLFRLFGSPFPRAALWASGAGTITGILYYYGQDEWLNSLANPFGYQIFAFVVGFALVFRSSLAYNRWWEGRTLLQTMMNRTVYFVTESLSCDTYGQVDPDKLSKEDKLATLRWQRELVHKCSLMFILQLMELRKDYDLDDVYEHDPLGPPPNVDSSEGLTLGQRISALLLKFTSASDVIGKMEDFEVKQSTVMPVIGGLRDDERQQLMSPLDIPGAKGKGHKFHHTRALVVYTQITNMLTWRLTSGALKVPPPLVARLQASLQEALASYGQAAKLSMTQFPFPWAQVVMYFLVIMVLSLPWVTISFTKQAWMGIILTFIIVLTYWSLNEVAIEMEDPFGRDPNDLPLSRFAFDFNQNLCVVAFHQRPAYFDELEAEEREKQQRQQQQQQAGADKGGWVDVDIKQQPPAQQVQQHPNTFPPPPPHVLNARPTSAARRAPPTGPGYNTVVPL